MMSTNCIPKPEGPPCTDSLEFAWSTMKPIKIGTAQADVCRLTYVGEPGIGFNRIEKYFASFGASFGQGWGSSFSKGAKFLFEELFIS